MSDLYRSAMTARLDKLPPPEAVVPYSDEEDAEEENDGLGSLPSLPGSGSSLPSTSGRQRRGPNADYSPISAAGYFEQAVEANVPRSHLNFRVYYSPSKARDGDATLVVCHHGAGYSGLSFACFASEVTQSSNGELGVLAFDARCHGKTKALESSYSEEDLSIEVLSQDAFNLLTTLFPIPSEAPTFLLVGHSMGGSVFVRTCPLLLENKYRVAGVAVLDVVEGSAIEALPFMHSLLGSRPEGFNSIEAAIEWHVSNHTIRNPISARVSVPSLLAPSTEGKRSPAFKWRTPLQSTSPYWENWFLGLSSKFLAVRTARLLVLAGTDRLDKELMIGQMQGKFQMVVVPDTGHMIHEDNPTRLAEIITEFWRRNERLPIGVKIKRVGEL